MTSTPAKQSIEIRVDGPGDAAHLADVHIPLRFGVPLPPGQVRFPCEGRLVSPTGEVFCTQMIPLAQWPDGSVRWMRVDALLRTNVVPELSEVWRLEVDSGSEIADRETPDRVPLQAGLTVVPNPADRIALAVTHDATVHGSGLLAQVFMKTARGSVRYGRSRTLRWMSHGPICYECAMEGTFLGVPGLFWRLALRVYPRVNAIHVKAMLRNTRRARHRGGLWDLGDPGSILLREFGLHIKFRPAMDRFFWRLAPSEDFFVLNGHQPVEDRASLRSQSSELLMWQVDQASSGGDNWKSFNHVNAQGEVRLPFRGYRVKTPEGESSGDRAEPMCCLQTEAFSWGFWMSEFWQEFPKRIDVGPRSATLAFLAENPQDVHELQGGEQKTYSAWMVCNSGHDHGCEVATRQLAALSCGIAAHGQIAGPVPEFPASLPSHNSWQGSQLAQFAEEVGFGPKGLLAGREEIDEYGWRHFGDVYASHEKTFYQGTLPFVSHYNNQFDLLRGLILCRLLSNDPRWDQLIHPLARHVMDIDLYHTSRDRSTFNGAMFWMTDHYLTAATAAHRAFSRKNAKRPGYGGGPSNEQNYTSGLTLYYLLWGEDDARDSVISLANWVISMEDGRQTPFFVADDGPTGLATATSSPDYHGPGRGSANSVNALLDAWLISGNNVYRTWAETLCRRVIHPKDDPDALDLLHAETRWSYTMFLEVVCKFLRIKCLFQEHDHMFEYLRRSLIRYCDWMVLHERPYLDRPEELEYPTEAWAAQEFRKAAVLFLAAAFVEPERASRYRKKALWFAEKAWEELNRFEARINPRTAAVILNEAVWHLAVDGDEPRDCCLQRRNEPLNIPPREVFIPQRARVREMLASPTGRLRIAGGLVNPYNWFRLAWILWRWRN